MSTSPGYLQTAKPGCEGELGFELRRSSIDLCGGGGTHHYVRGSGVGEGGVQAGNSEGVGSYSARFRLPDCLLTLCVGADQDAPPRLPNIGGESPV
jgi:hypothetical protein